MDRWSLYEPFCEECEGAALKQESDGDWVLYKEAAALVAELEAQLAAMQERERWIAVTERLPEISVAVRKFQVVVEAEFFAGQFFDKSSDPINNVTHWRELPALPKEA